jgi:ribosomal protein L37E
MRAAHSGTRPVRIRLTSHRLGVMTSRRCGSSALHVGVSEGCDTCTWGLSSCGTRRWALAADNTASAGGA